MLRHRSVGLLSLGLLLVLGGGSQAVVFKTAILKNYVVWQTDYNDAYIAAQRDKKMLLIYFSPTATPRTTAAGPADDSVSAAISGADIADKLADYVCARLPLDASGSGADGKSVRLLGHGAFAELRNAGGVAVIDLAHPNTPYYARVVSVIPMTPGKYYHFQASHVPVLFDLPEGTLTQRTMIFAIRIHPERPASTSTLQEPVLLDEAAKQSNLQARIGVQGHHQWESRFHRIISRLVGRGYQSAAPREVVAESWPNQNLVDSCIDCVDSWRHSSGHWDAVRTRHSSYAYDIQKGSNGIWYATGIFAN